MLTQSTQIDMFPRPTQVESVEGTFCLRGGIAVLSPSLFAKEARVLADILKSAGSTPHLEPTGGRYFPHVQFHIADDSDELGAEGYKLSIRPEGIEICAATGAGAFYAVQTIRQMLPPEVEKGNVSQPTLLPCVEILDKPKFGWRGMMLDVSRHFFPPAEVKQFLDLLAMHKMNVFHWHLVDDGGWRMEVKRYPNLTDQGAWRAKKDFLWDYHDIEFPALDSGRSLYGGFYTQDEIRDIVRYAADRHITVLPEIEMPGHSLAATSSYPEFICADESADRFVAKTKMHFPNVFCAGKEGTFTFLEHVLEETLALFPSKYIHIGGDEVDKQLWAHCSDCQKRMADEGLATEHELQSYFIRRIEAYLNSMGRQLVGWDEILEGGLAPNATVMSWRGEQGGIAAAKAGHDVVMTPVIPCYFDYDYNTISSQTLLGYNPVPSLLTPDEAKHVLGAQANLWSEYVPDLATAQQRVFPRLAAMAEALWTGKSSAEDLEDRIAHYCLRLEALGINFEGAKHELPTHAVVYQSGPTYT